ncbi:MAG: hypothetical protein JEZ04_07145 [Spirochaetales bacterium]|nr:hypothetical protein [Spirochaetales bacterium]
MRRKIAILLTTVLFGLLTASCTEGIFNFSAETGNISFSFSRGSTLGEDIGKVAFNFTNSDNGERIRRELFLSDGSADCYIARADAGNWNVSTTVYLSDGTVAADRSDSFVLDLGETAIAELSYWSDSAGSGIDILWEKTAGSTIQPVISIDKLNTLISAYHRMGSDTVMHTSLMCAGSGFDDYLNGIRLTFPDSAYFEYTGGWARAVSDVTVETAAFYLLINIGDYSSRGNYSLTLTDLNDVEISETDNCSFVFDPLSGTAKINSWVGGLTLLDSEYDKNDSVQAGTYLFYVVDKSDGTQVNMVAAIPTAPVVYTVTTAGDLDLPAGTTVPGAGFRNLVLITVDAELTQAEINNAFVPNTTNLNPNNIVPWLYTNFGDRINFVGISAAEN